VDDIFLIIPRNKVDIVLEIFNKYHSRLKFTHEIEINNSLNFLNVSVTIEVVEFAEEIGQGELSGKCTGE